MDTTCSACLGVGSNGGLECAVCSGTGLVGLTDTNFKQITVGDQIALTGVVWDKLINNTTIPTNVFQAYKVLECLDATEYNALTDAQKDGVLAILACGLVDLNEGKVGKTRLWNWFGEESTTVANLTALIE